jgi:hypothetical protein
VQGALGTVFKENVDVLMIVKECNELANVDVGQ